MLLNVIVAAFSLLGVYAGTLALHLLLPAQHTAGYVRDADTGLPLQYRLNGLLTLITVLAVWFYLGWIDALSWDWFYQQRWIALATAFVVGIGYTAWVVLRESPTGRGLVVDLFLGRKENPQYLGGRVDAKMFLYQLGATMLALNVVSFAAYHYFHFGSDANIGVYVHSSLLLFFIFDYFCFERVHLYTYDLFAERMGFKLGWGCLVFYPFFYCIGLWGTAHLPAPAWHGSQSVVWLGACVAIFFAGWILARGANLQKYNFKLDPARTTFGIQPIVIGQGDRQLLASGFWATSRHINYLGEILMALGIALSLGHIDSLWPWLYPLYYIALLVPRERDDEARCAQKYGATWDAYKRAVPARIVPKFY